MMICVTCPLSSWTAFLIWSSLIESSDEVASIANRARDVFDATGEVPTSVETIRTCLFFEQRRWRHFDADPYEDPATKTYLHTLLATLRDLTGGTIEGPIDHPF